MQTEEAPCKQHMGIKSENITLRLICILSLRTAEGTWFFSNQKWINMLICEDPVKNRLILDSKTVSEEEGCCFEPIEFWNCGLEKRCSNTSRLRAAVIL